LEIDAALVFRDRAFQFADRKIAVGIVKDFVARGHLIQPENHEYTPINTNDKNQGRSTVSYLCRNSFGSHLACRYSSRLYLLCRSSHSLHSFVSICGYTRISVTSEMSPQR